MDKKELSLYHLIKQPKETNKKAPLLIMLHGYGSGAHDLFSFAGELPDNIFIVSAQAPFTLPPYGNAWYEIHFNNTQGKFSDEVQAVKSRELIVKFIDEVLEHYPVDKNNVTLLGFSQGTILSYSVALSYPEKVKNVIAISGYLNEDIVKANYSSGDFSHLSVYISHGTQDPVIPVTWARKAPEKLKELNIDYKYSEFPTGHGVSPANLADIVNWIRKNIN